MESISRKQFPEFSQFQIASNAVPLICQFDKGVSLADVRLPLAADANREEAVRLREEQAVTE